jgi:hypothetical protein
MRVRFCLSALPLPFLGWPTRPPRLDDFPSNNNAMLLVTLGPMAEFGLYKIAHLQSFRSELSVRQRSPLRPFLQQASWVMM